jgi:23S rRNA pseudouridine2605 synthase
MRLNKYLAVCGVASRRQADRLIAEGRVSINDTIINEMGVRVEPGDIVLVDGEPIEAPQSYTVIAMHKPPGYLCTREDPFGRPTVYDLLPPELQNLPYVGRLDLQSRGLLLFTDDGELAFRLTHPSYDIPRQYAVWLDRDLSSADMQAIENGLELEDGEQLREAKVKKKSKHAEITLQEGKNREIRRMMSTLGYEIRDLKRFAYAGIHIDGLGRGKWRKLNEEELGELYAWVDLE